MVAGYSPYDAKMLPHGASNKLGRKLLHAFVVGEEFKGAMWSAGSIGMNLAWLCTGRNLAYRRAVFDEVGGYERIKMSTSGDDDLFIQIVRRLTKWNIRYASSPDSFVRTAPPESFAKFIEQRTRHFSAGKYFTLPMKTFFFLFHGSNLIVLLGLFTIFFSVPIFYFAAAAFAVKLTCDFILAITATHRLRRTTVHLGFNFLNFLLTEILYIFYNTFIGPLGFVRTFTWKQD
jgi:cellulose synthase/poly-beta-1,6-N-acetylglucosamine synthase-like glycosyltransferase